MHIIDPKDTDPEEFYYTLDDAKKMGKYPDSNLKKPWMAHTRTMLKYKARALALRDKFAEVLGGAKIAELDFDKLPTHEPRDVVEATPSNTMSSAEINNAL